MDLNSFGWPQWLWFAMMAANLLATAYMHGKPRTGEHNIFTSLIGTGLGFVLLSYGGFFK